MENRTCTYQVWLAVSFLVNEFNIRSLLHGQVSSAAVNHTYVLHEGMNVCTNLNINFKACSENVNYIDKSLHHKHYLLTCEPINDFICLRDCVVNTKNDLHF